MLFLSPLVNESAMGFAAAVLSLALLFTFLSLALYLRQRRKERDTYYRFELRKRALEQGAPAEVLLEMQLQEDGLQQRRRRESLRLGGLITAGAGLGVLVICLAKHDTETIGVAALPLCIGLALYVYAQWMAPRGTDAGAGGRAPRS